MSMQSLATIGYEMKTLVTDRKSDNNNMNNFSGHWGPISKSENCKNYTM